MRGWLSLFVGRMTVGVEDPQKRRWPVGIDRGIGKAVLHVKLTGVMPKPSEVVSNQTHRVGKSFRYLNVR